MPIKERLKKELDELDAKVNALSAEEKHEYRDLIVGLKQKRDNLKERWEDMKDEGEEMWEKTKETLSGGLSDLQSAYDDLKSRMK